MKDYCAEFKNYLIKVKKVSNNTLDSYLRDLQNYLEFLKKQKMRKVWLVK